MNLIGLAHEMSIEPKWQLYAEYCVVREKAWRKPAFVVLKSFIQEAKTWDWAEQKRFATHFLTLYEQYHHQIPHMLPGQLSIELLKPWLLRWCAEETSDSRPCRWAGQYLGLGVEYIHQALAINPKDDAARAVLISDLTGEIWFATHHLPDYYIGDVSDAWQWQAQAAEHVALLVDEKMREFWAKDLADEMSNVHWYWVWQQSGHGDFEQWLHDNAVKLFSGSESNH